MRQSREAASRAILWAVVIVVLAVPVLQFGGCVYQFFQPIPPVLQDRAFTARIEADVRGAIGPDYTLEISAGPLERVEHPSGIFGPQNSGWRRRTIVVARAKSDPRFAVYAEYTFNTSGVSPHAVLDTAELARTTAWSAVVGAIPADVRPGFYEACAKVLPYDPAGWRGYQVYDVINLDEPALTGRYRAVYETPDHGGGGPFDVTLDAATRTWSTNDRVMPIPPSSPDYP